MYFARQHEVIDIVLVNRPSQLSSQVEIHPWHMHSHKHWTRTIHPGTFSFSRLNAIYASNPNFTNPIQRDTSIVYASPGAAYLNQSLPSTNDDGGFAVLRYKVKSNNAGFFLLHCHLQFHLAMGMATVWSINPAALNPLHANTHNIQGLDPAYLTPGTNVPALT
jgi:FtsP/CotA-like multicopper oxidase with cupredoxin domain